MQQEDSMMIVKSLIKKLLDDKKIDDSDKLFMKHVKKYKEIDFCYFLCIGLPFSISKN